MKGILTNCITNEKKEIELKYRIEQGTFYLIGGPTGYESFSIGSRYTDLNGMCLKGWCACAGTPGTWDRLVISAEEMKKAIPSYLTNVR